MEQLLGAKSRETAGALKHRRHIISWFRWSIHGRDARLNNANIFDDEPAAVHGSGYEP
jgi:hypothetical protein